MKSLAALQTAARRLPLEPYVVDRPVNERGQYQLELSPDFPFAIKRLYFDAGEPRPPLTWHAYQEVFILLSGQCRLQMGEGVLEMASGDVLVMDHLKLHAILDFPGPGIEVVVIRFLPELVHSAGSVASDQLILLPFYCQIEEQPHVLRATHRAAAEVHGTLSKMLECYAELSVSSYGATGARVYFLVLLYQLARHFEAGERLREQFGRQQARSGRLREVFAYIGAHYAERVSLPEMANLAGLSKAQFHRMFKRAAGMAPVDYIAHVRLTHAARLLQESDASIAEVASMTGFADQSYFDRRFRQHFHCTPLHYRKAGPPSGVAAARPPTARLPAQAAQPQVDAVNAGYEPPNSAQRNGTRRGRGP
jgi:AraC family transcriptional regulator, melibiose operon regulatory protein